MPIKIDNDTYYRTSEACQLAGISKATLFRWIKSGVLEDAVNRDRKGWRLFTENDVENIKSEATRVNREQTLIKKTIKGVS